MEKMSQSYMLMTLSSIWGILILIFGMDIDLVL